MRAIVVSKFGGPDCMKLVTEHPIPEPGPGQVLVRVQAASINPVDGFIRAGQYAVLPELPYTPGRDGAGVIEKVHRSIEQENVQFPKPGDYCWFWKPVTGSYAEYAVVSRECLFPLPKNNVFAGASLGTAYGTAHRALFEKARLHEQIARNKALTVFIHGISGGVGLAACQLARCMGAIVYGTAGTQEGIKHCMEMSKGPQKVWNHHEKAYIEQIMKEHPTGFNIVLEMWPNANLNVDLSKVTANQGTLVVIVIGNRGTCKEFDIRSIMTKGLTIKAVELGIATDEACTLIATDLNTLLERGDIAPQIGHIVPLDEHELAEVHRGMATTVPGKGSFGEVLIDMSIYGLD